MTEGERGEGWEKGEGRGGEEREGERVGQEILCGE